MKKKLFRCCTADVSMGFIKEMIPYLKNKYELRLLSSPGENLSRLSEQYGLKAYGVQMERHISPFKDMISLFNLIRVFAVERPDMVHSITPKAGLLCMMAAWITRVPIRIHTFTGLVWPTSTGMKRRLLMLTDKLTCQCASHIIPEGKGVMNDLKNGGITKKPMKVLGFGNIKGVDMDRLNRERYIDRSTEIKAEYGMNSCFSFLFVGRIVKDKGIEELVEAFDRLQKKYLNVKLLLIGRDDNDPISETTRSLIASNAGILLLGPKFDDDLFAHYVASDCFVLPSYREGFPNAVMEAGALGLPSIVTDINGSREIIVHGKNGLIVPSKNVSALFNAMEQMLVDKESTEYMASKARNLISSRFDNHFVQQCLYDYYSEVLSNEA